MKVKHKRAKRKAGALDRYLKKPLSEVGADIQQSGNIKVEDPIEMFEKEQKEKQAFVPVAAEPKPEVPEAGIQTIEVSPEPLEVRKDPTDNLPIFCNHCNLQKICPDGKGVVRKNQKEMIVCKRRAEFRRLVQEAGTNNREGLLQYIHNLRNVNNFRIGRMLYDETLTNKGIDRDLSLLIDKQMNHALSEYKIRTPQDKGGNSLSVHFTQIHNTVDAYNELPSTVKGQIMALLKNKVAQLKSPTSIPIPSTTTQPLKQPIDASEQVPLSQVHHSVPLSVAGGTGGKFSKLPDSIDSMSVEDL